MARTTHILNDGGAKARQDNLLRHAPRSRCGGKAATPRARGSMGEARAGYCKPLLDALRGGFCGGGGGFGGGGASGGW